MGSWEDLAQHLSETGHKGVSGQCSEDVNSTEMPNQQTDETHGTTSPKCSNRTGVGQASTVRYLLLLLHLNHCHIISLFGLY